MQFQRLRLSGFKSFVEPTEFRIEPGLTGIVGPNGCGKSNLLEALRWVMGANSAKAMRAGGMDDVIFSGTAGRPSREFAEVTLLVTEARGRAPAPFQNEDVLEITRRIRRELGSTYRINGRDVRAKDVALLFADAATGAHSADRSLASTTVPLKITDSLHSVVSTSSQPCARLAPMPTIRWIP